MTRTPYQQSLHEFRRRLETAVEADTSRWSTAARRVLAEHDEKDGRCTRCVAHPASTDHWIGVGVGATYPCPSVLAIAWGFAVERSRSLPFGWVHQGGDVTTSEQIELADRLVEARRHAKLSQQQVADQTGIPRSGVSDIERGLRGVESLELRALARLYAVDVNVLLGVDAPVPASPVLLGVGGPGYVRLNAFGALIREAYDHVPYLVGSAVRGKTWRDVDVRLILPDDEFQAMFGVGRGWGLNPLFCLLTAGVSALGKEMTGLPIDFQFQPQTHANDKYSGARQPLGIWFAPCSERTDADG